MNLQQYQQELEQRTLKELPVEHKNEMRFLQMDIHDRNRSKNLRTHTYNPTENVKKIREISSKSRQITSESKGRGRRQSGQKYQIQNMVPDTKIVGVRKKYFDKENFQPDEILD